MDANKPSSPSDRYIQMSGRRRIRGSALHRLRGALLDQIKAWLVEAPQEKLKQLTEMMRAIQLNSMAEKLEKTLNEIEQQTSNCTVV